MNDYRSICIVQLGRIGDLILSTPLLKTVKEAFPQAKLHVLAGRNNHFFLNNYPLVDSVHVHTKRPLDTLRLILELRHERFDLWIDPKDHPSTESTLFVRLARPRESIGFNGTRGKNFTHSVKTNKEQYNDHAIDRYLNALLPLGIHPSIKQPLLFCNATSETVLATFLKERGIEKYCLINLSASKTERLWEEDKWHALMRLLAEKGLVCLISSIARDLPQAQRLAASSKKVFHYPTPSLDDLISLVNRSSMVVSPDTAVVHIASAFDRPTVGLYADCGWNLNSFAPRARDSVMVVNKKSETLIRDIEVAEVFGAVQSIIDKRPAQ